MIRLFKVYYPVRTLILLAGEALIVWSSFLLGAVRARERRRRRSPPGGSYGEASVAVRRGGRVGSICARGWASKYTSRSRSGERWV